MALWPADNPSSITLVLYETRAQAGFPSPADDHIETRLDLNALVVRRPAATFYARASGDSMTGVGIADGDLLVVDRSLKALPGDIVVAALDGGLTVKRLAKTSSGWELAPANPAFPSLPINPDEGVTIWGVVTYSLHRHCDRDR